MKTITVPAIEVVAEAIDCPPEDWMGQCHTVSLAIVQSGLLGEPGPACRVVRGAANYAIGSQHSWICLGEPYDPRAIYVDYTAHQWKGNDLANVVVATAKQAYEDFQDATIPRGHAIHGYNPTSIWKFGRPHPGRGEHFMLDARELSDEAKSFVSVLGPMDADAWADLCEYPQGAWPYKEIARAVIAQVPTAQTRLRIDIYSMAGDLNVDGLYW